VVKLAKPCYEAIKKISKGKWEWEPEKWQGVIYRGKVDLVLHVLTPIYVDLLSKSGVFIKDLIPLLHWERIRKILKQCGYSFSITSGASGGEITVYANIGTDRVYAKYHNNDLQLEVMRAVIELGKEE